MRRTNSRGIQVVQKGLARVIVIAANVEYAKIHDSKRLQTTTTRLRMKQQELITGIEKHDSIAVFQTIRVGAMSIYRSRENYDVRWGNKSYASGQIPNTANPGTYPLRMAVATAKEMHL